ncbi:TRAP transporter large permease [Amorphus sp. 3PC139-8]|uniref:TRAP transporter large permease n=1 Tax=Amorphus sp. 3PC139-8 TaxID=2735676 RepID=UPI00345D54C5
MPDVAIGLVAIAVSIGLIAYGVPIGLALGLCALVGIAIVAGPPVALAMLKTAPYELAANWEFSAIPMFILMGTVAFHSGMTQSLFRAGRLWLGFLPGGLAVATNYACAGFGAASGSSLATTIAMCRLTVPEMRRYGYDPGLATGVVAAAGTLGSMIPPSVLMVIFGIFAEVSIPKLFLAGIVPGVLTAAVYSLMIVVRCRANPSLAPAPDTTEDPNEKWRALAEIWPLPLLILAVIGSIYTGVATATEAGALGTVTALLIALARRTLTWKILYDSLLDSLINTAAIFFIAVGAVLLTRLLSFCGVPAFLTDIMLQWSVDPLLLILATAVLYLILGCLLDPLGMIFLTLPIIIPMYQALDVNLIWLGVLVVKFVEIGLMTPPVGMNVFAVKTLNPDIPISVIFKGVSWFLLCELAILAALIAFPQMTLLFV